MLKEDMSSVALIHLHAFSGQLGSTRWVTCHFKAYPRMMIFFAINELNQAVSYIQWLQKSGFQKKSILELEQIAVLQPVQGAKIGTQFIEKSLKSVKDYLTSQNGIVERVHYYSASFILNHQQELRTS